MSGSQEQRKDPRVAIDITLDLFARGSVVSRGPGRITDLSLGGVKIETKAVFHIGEHVVLRFDLTGNIPLDIEGAIVRRLTHPNSIDYGVKFTSLGFFKKLKMKQFVLARLTR